MEETTLAIQERLARNEFLAQIFSIATFALASIWFPTILLGFFASTPVGIGILTVKGNRWHNKGAIVYGRLFIGLGLFLGILTTLFWLWVAIALGPTEILQALAK